MDAKARAAAADLARRYGTRFDLDALRKQVLLVARALLAAPDWYDTPPITGTYVVYYADDSSEAIEVDDVTRWSESELSGIRVFGPIPPDPRATP